MLAAFGCGIPAGCVFPAGTFTDPKGDCPGGIPDCRLGPGVKLGCAATGGDTAAELDAGIVPALDDEAAPDVCAAAAAGLVDPNGSMDGPCCRGGPSGTGIT